jgi:glucan-binding repeat-containing protein
MSGLDEIHRKIVKRKRIKKIKKIAFRLILFAIAVFIVISAGRKIYSLTHQTGFKNNSKGLYYLLNGDRYSNEWFEVDGKSYYADKKGYLKTGLTKIDGATYYFDEDGACVKGRFQKLDDGYMYFDADGKQVTGEVEILSLMNYLDDADYSTHYFDDSGYAYHDWVDTDGTLYFYDKYGKRLTGCVTASTGEHYYALASGGYLTGRNEVDGKVYYFDENGVAQSGYTTDEDGNTIFVEESGEVAVGLFKNDEGTYSYADDKGEICTDQLVEYEGNYYWLDDDGNLITDTTYESEGKKYQIGSDGIVATGWLTLEDGETGYALSNGEICYNTEADIDDEAYYFDENGHLTTGGWVTWNGCKGYANEDGTLLKWSQTIDGNRYYFNGHGVMQTGWITYSNGKQSYAGDDGILLIGYQYIEYADCEFDDNGILTSKVQKFDKLVALTYDDGPSKYTPIILDALEETNSQCTFFVVGSRVKTYSDTVKRASELGCEIASHTYDHVYLTDLDKDEIASQINKTNEAVKSITGSNCPLLRPPGGFINDDVCEAANVPFILWTVDTKDWSTRNEASTIKAATKNIKDGDIILMHDLYESTANGAKEIIETLNSQGFACVTVTELANARGGYEGGKEYFSFRNKK